MNCRDIVGSVSLTETRDSCEVSQKIKGPVDTVKLNFTDSGSPMIPKCYVHGCRSDQQIGPQNYVFDGPEYVEPGPEVPYYVVAEDNSLHGIIKDNKSPSPGDYMFSKDKLEKCEVGVWKQVLQHGRANGFIPDECLEPVDRQTGMAYYNNTKAFETFNDSPSDPKPFQSFGMRSSGDFSVGQNPYPDSVYSNMPTTSYELLPASFDSFMGN